MSGANGADEKIALSAVLAGTGHALDDMRKTLADLEARLMQDVADIPASALSVPALQSLDVITQNLAELSAVMDRVAKSVPADARVAHEAILGPVKLAELKQKLILHKGIDSLESQMQQGHVALF